MSGGSCTDVYEFERTRIEVNRFIQCIVEAIERFGIIIILHLQLRELLAEVLLVSLHYIYILYPKF